MKKMLSERDAIVSRGIWYKMTLVSLLAQAISISLLWPHGENCESSKSRFYRDCAVSATTFYAVMLLRYYFFTDPLSHSYKGFTTDIERIPQRVISVLAFTVVIYSPLYIEEYDVSVSLFAISLVTGGIGLIQLSDKLRMETRYTLVTLFLLWSICLSGIYLFSSYDQNTQGQALLIGAFCESLVSYLIFLF
ncbi:hypothetical protein N665_0385s0020 [Sinapis alba]|nr:hypothetical protein N665_0385s0020 [Sinapis alba]